MKRFLLISLLTIPYLLVGQTKHDLALFLGYANSGTDVHSWARHGEGVFAKANIAYGLNYTYNINTSLGLRLGYTGTTIEGNDIDVDLPGHDIRAYSFTSPLHEVGAFFQWDLLGKKRWTDGAFKKTFSPYILAGAAVSFTNPDVIWSEAVQHDERDITELTKTNLQIPIGVGVKYDISEKMYIAAEFRHTIPLNDQIDGITYSANLDDNDSYTFVGVNLGFRLGVEDRDKDGIADKDDDCPDIAGIAALNGCPDADGDGITDAKDDCPMEAGPQSLSGCPDGDADGIADKYDDCPAVAGTAQFKGCPDSDNDGIRDIDDKCPSVSGTPAYGGCPPPDMDGDGVEDSKDMCPKTPGTLNGCPDSDEDGFADKDDKCPTVKGTLEGCPDMDGDGVADAVDKCPKVKGTVANNGCPDMDAVTPSAPIARWIKELYFNTASSGLDKKARLDVIDIIKVSKEYPEAKFMISGYTDTRGENDMNQKLSERRAKSVYDILVKRGVDPTRLRYAGYGEKVQKEGTTSKTYNKNRRVEVSFIK